MRQERPAQRVDAGRSYRRRPNEKIECAPAFLRTMDKVFDLISQICLVLAGTALVVMTVIFAWLVFGRYVLNDTPTWVEQVSFCL